MMADLQTNTREDAHSRGLDLAAGSGLRTTHAEEQVGSQQQLNLEDDENEGQEQHTKKSVVGKVKDKAKKLKSKVKKGLKLGSSVANEEPNDEGSSDSESQDQHAAAPQQESASLDIRQILEQNPQFKGDGTWNEGGEPSVSDLVEDAKKPITPFRSDGPTDALQAVPTQYKDYYYHHSSDDSHDGVDSEKREEEVPNQEGLAGDRSDLSKSFLGAINGNNYPHQAAFDSKPDSLGIGSKHEAEVEKLNSGQFSDLGKEDGAVDEKNDQNDDDKLKGHDLENRVTKEPSSADSDQQTNNAPKLEEFTYQAAGSLEGKVLPKFEAALSKEENQKPSFVSRTQTEDGDLDDERKSFARGDLEEGVFPKFEDASSRKENQRETGGPSSDMEPSGHDKLPNLPLEHASSESGEAFGIGQVTPSGYEADADSNLPSDEEGLSIPSQTYNHSQRIKPVDPTSAQQMPSQASTPEQTDQAIPLSQRAFGGLSWATNSLVDATSSVAETVGSSMGYYSHQGSTNDQLPEADKGSLPNVFQAESEDEKSKLDQNESEFEGGRDPTTTTSEPLDASEGGRGSWREWLSESITPTKELLSSTIGTKVQNEDDRQKHLNNGTEVETQDPLKDGDFRSYEESGARDKELGSKPEEPLVSANFQSLPEVLAFPAKGAEAEDS